MARRARLVFLLGLISLLGACLSPTLPLPPPGEPVVEGPDGSGQITLMGSTAPQALVVGWNIRLNDGDTFQTSGDGRYQLTMMGQSGDVVRLFYLRGNEVSPSIEVEVPEPASP